MYTYNQEFYRYINRGSLASAAVVVPQLLSLLPFPITNVLDVGCGAGAWLSVWKAHGAQVRGLDGAYVDASALLIDVEEFQAHDLTTAFSPDSCFDLVQSLEVAEHLPQEAAADFVANLCRCTDLVMFSAAAPGQGGENHINEQPYEYWQAHFDAQGFVMYDAIRDQILENNRVMPWYRFNTFLYVRRDALPEVHAALESVRVEQGVMPLDKSPLLYQWRKRAIRALPVRQRTQIAVLKKRLQNTLRRNTGPAEAAESKEHPPG